MTSRLIHFPTASPVRPEPSDEMLVRACARGDSSALATLFDRRADDVARFLARIRGSDGDDIEDLLQMTFLEVQRAAHRFKGQSAVRTWLFAIAANLASNHLRSKIRRRESLSLLAHIPRSSVETPGEIVERRQLMDRLAVALGRLKHDLRVAFTLCDVEELAGTEVARALGIRPGTLWRRLHDARKELRRALEDA